jgi:phospholipid transport system substrate-binding protein
MPTLMIPIPAAPARAAPLRTLFRCCLIALGCLNAGASAAQDGGPAAAAAGNHAELAHTGTDPGGKGTGDTTADSDPAAAIVEELHTALLGMMQNASTLGYAGRYAQIEPIVVQRFDTPLIVKVILSRNWDGIGETERAEFIRLFERLSAATYASRFDSYKGQKFVETGRENLKAGRVLIKTELRRPDDTPVKLDYLIHRNGAGEWRIISVIANGVNDLSLKRAEYAAVIKERGFPGLIEDLQKKIDDMEIGTGT